MLRRIGFGLLALVAVAIGLIVGTFNAQEVTLDLLWIRLQWPLGLILLCALVLGLLLGAGAVSLAQVLPLRMKLRKLQANSEHNPVPGNISDDA